MKEVKTRYGKLYLRKGMWWAYFSPHKGVYIRKSIGHKILNQAKTWLETRFKEAASQKFFDRIEPKRKFADLAVIYSRDKKLSQGDLSYVFQLVKFFGSMEPTQIRRPNIIEFEQNLIKLKVDVRENHWPSIPKTTT